MGVKIIKAGFLGFLVDILFLGILTFVFPWDFGGWMDGFPFGTASASPGFLVGCLVGIVIGAIIGKRLGKVEKSVFIGAVCGGVIGAFVTWFMWFGYY